MSIVRGPPSGTAINEGWARWSLVGWRVGLLVGRDRTPAGGGVARTQCIMRSIILALFGIVACRIGGTGTPQIVPLFRIEGADGLPRAIVVATYRVGRMVVCID